MTIVGIHSLVLEIVQAMVKAIVRYYMHNMFSLTHNSSNLMCVLVLVSVDVVSFLSIEFLCVWLVVGME